MTVTALAPEVSGRTVDDIVGALKDHVWVLIRANMVPAAMALLQASLDEYLEAAAAMAAPVEVLEGIVMDDELDDRPDEEPDEGMVDEPATMEIELRKPRPLVLSK